jgi:hypothetical protein
MSAGAAAVPVFPGQVVKAGSSDRASVLSIQGRLNAAGCGPVQEDGVFSAETLEAVQLFQARSVDADGSPLTVDGVVGPMTWAALFRLAALPSITVAANSLLARTLVVAGSQIGVMERPPGSNRGPEVDQYLAAVGLNARDGSFAWCAAFIYWCFREASTALSTANPAIKTAGALEVWNTAGTKGFRRVTCAEATDTPSLVQPGMVFVLATGGVHGHVGFVKSVAGVVLTTIEGNTNEGGSREGIGVFQRVGRRVNSINRGFVDFSSRV